MGAVGVIRSITLASCGTDIRPAFTVMFGKAVCSGLCRSCLQIEQLTRIFFLIIRKTVTHMCQYFFCEFLRTFITHITAKPCGIQSGFIHSDQADSWKMIVKTSQITFGIWIQTFLEQFGNYISLDFQWTCWDIHHTIQPQHKIIFIFCLVCNTRHIDCYNTDRTCTLSWTKESACFLS